jgi:hypothetical protein
VKMYDGIKICPKLRPSELCVVLEQYRKGEFERRFHEHIPRRSLSAKRRIELLRALVVSFYGFSGMGPGQIVNAYVKKPRKGSFGLLYIRTTRPEPGVLRHYCGANTVAWIDDVYDPSKFRAKLQK